MVGHAAKFDYQGLKEIPAIDLPELRPFFESMLIQNQRRALWKEDRLSFKTPDAWLTSPAIRRHYKDVVFGRDQASGGDANLQVIGIGHAAFNQAIDQALGQEAALAMVEGLEDPVVVAKVFDRITLSAGTVRSRIFGIAVPSTEQDVAILTDDKLLVMLNQCKARAKPLPPEGFDRQLLHQAFTVGIDRLEQSLSSLGLPFKHPDYQPLGLLWPASAQGINADSQSLRARGDDAD